MNDRLLKKLILETIQEVLGEGEKVAKLTHTGKALKYLYDNKEGVDIDAFKKKFGEDIVSKLPKNEYIASQKTGKIRLTRKGISRTEGLLDISHDDDED
jgi:hypothetical protein